MAAALAENLVPEKEALPTFSNLAQRFWNLPSGMHELVANLSFPHGSFIGGVTNTAPPVPSFPKKWHGGPSP
jgi:hypothetical protein